MQRGANPVAEIRAAIGVFEKIAEETDCEEVVRTCARAYRSLTLDLANAEKLEAEERAASVRGGSQEIRREDPEGD